jgi:hypothetical protein
MITSRITQPLSYPGYLLQKVKQASLLVATLILVAGRLNAIPITGEVHFVGSFTATGGTGLSDATGVAFSPAFVFTTSGDFSSLTPFSLATFNAFTFAPLSPPSGPLWEAGDFSFTLESITIDVQNGTQLNLSGNGFLKGPGDFEATPATWNFQGGGSAGLTFRTDTRNVPDSGNTVLLLGATLVGLGAGRRFRALAA